MGLRMAGDRRSERSRGRFPRNRLCSPAQHSFPPSSLSPEIQGWLYSRQHPPPSPPPPAVGSPPSLRPRQRITSAALADLDFVRDVLHLYHPDRHGHSRIYRPPPKLPGRGKSNKPSHPSVALNGHPPAPCKSVKNPVASFDTCFPGSPHRPKPCLCFTDRCSFKPGPGFIREANSQIPEIMILRPRWVPAISLLSAVSYRLTQN